MLPSWFADTICGITKKFWGTDEKLVEGAETQSMEPYCEIKTTQNNLVAVSKGEAKHLVGYAEETLDAVARK